MRLRIITPLSVVVDAPVERLTAEDESGGFGIWPGHAPFVTALTISIVIWHSAGAEHYCALRGGVITVTDGTAIDITTREAVTGEDLATLDGAVLARFRSDADRERAEHTETLRLQFNAIRHMVSRLRPGRQSGEFR